MGDINRDPELDRQTADPRAQPEKLTGADSDAAEAQGGGSATRQTPLEPTGQPDGVAGTGGETKNQDATAQ